MTTDHYIPDTLFAAYRTESLYRRNPYPRTSAGFSDARHVSVCHSSSTYIGRRGQELCVVCKQPCDLDWLEARRNPSRVTERRNGQTVEVETMRVCPTRVVSRDAEDSAAVQGAWRLIALSRLVERRPREASDKRWAFVLMAWAMYLDHGRERAARNGQYIAPGAGIWTEGTVRAAVDLGREVVTRRARRKPALVEAVLGGGRSAA